MSLLENVTLHMELDNSDFKREFKEATTVVDKQMNALTLGADAFAAKWEDITSNLRSFKRVASGLAISAGIYAVTGAITGASEAILTFRNNLEASEISMTYFAENALQAKEYIRELEDFAAYTPFSTESAISMAQYLQAMSVPINASKSMLKVISDTAAATGATEQNMQRIVTALGQILTKGKLAAEEVRQLANANIPIYDILKQQLNLTGQEIKNLGNLNINASKAVVAILDGLKDRYEGAAEQIAETLGGMTETIKDDALIISEAFFHGSLDRLEDRITGIRDKLDEWRDIALHQGTGGMITAIIGDLDPTGSGKLEQFIIAAIAGFKNLSDTIHDFATRNGTALKIFTSTAYTGLMSLTIAADYLLRVFNKVQAAGDALVAEINQLTGMSLTLSDVVAGLLVFKTVGKALYFAGNTALWAGKQFVTLGTSITSIIPGIAGASAMTKGLVAGMLTLGAAAATAYLGLKAIQGATGVSDSSKLVTDEYTKQMEEYNKALESQAASLNEDYSSIADNWAANMSDALDDTEKKAKKTAKKIEKSWLMSFDEVFQIWEDPTSKLVDDDLKLFEDIDWGSFFKLPIFRFPEELKDALEAPSYNIADAIDTAQDELSTLNKLLPAIIMGTSLLGTIIKNRTDYIRSKRADGTPPPDSELTGREAEKALDEIDAKLKKSNDLVGKLADEYNKSMKEQENYHQAIRKQADKIDALEDVLAERRIAAGNVPTEENKQLIATAEEQLALEKKAYQVLLDSKPNTDATLQHTGKIERLTADIKQLEKRSFDLQITSGKTRTVNVSNLDKGTAVLLADKTNSEINKLASSVDELGRSLELKATVAATTEAINDEGELIINSLSALNAKTDSGFAAVTAQIKTTGKHIAEQYNTPGGTSNLNMSAYKNALDEHFKLVSKEANNVVAAILSVNEIDQYKDISDSLLRLRTLKDDVSTLIDGYIIAGIPLEPGQFDTLNQQIAKTESYKKALEKYIAARDTYDTELKLHGNKNTTAYISDESIEKLAAKVTKTRGDTYIAQDALRETSTIAEAATKALDKLETLNNRVALLPGMFDRDAISAVYSLGTEIKNLLADGQVYSTSNALWNDRIRTNLESLTKRVEALPDTVINDYSKRIVGELSRILGYEANGNDITTYTSLDELLDDYKSFVTEQYKLTIESIKDSASKQIAEVKNSAVLTLRQQEIGNRYAASINKGIESAEKATISKSAYTQEQRIFSAFDRVIQQLEDNAAISTGDVRRLYAGLSKVVRDSAGIADATVKINEFLNTDGAKAALRIGNTAETVSRIWQDTNLSKFNALATEMLNAKKATTPTPTPSAGTPVKGLTQHPDWDTIIDKVDEVKLSFDDAIKSIGYTADVAGELVPVLDTFEAVLEAAIADNTKLHQLIDTNFDIAGLDIGERVPDSIVDKLQHINTVDEYTELVDEVRQLKMLQYEHLDKLNNIETYGKTFIAGVESGKYDVPGSVAYYNDNADNTLREFIKDTRSYLEGRITAEGVENYKREDALKWLAEKYDNRVGIARGFEQRTGALKDTAFKGRSTANILEEFYRWSDTISDPLAIARENLRLGMFSGSMTAQGVTAQGALAKMFAHAVHDEIASSLESNIQIGISKAFNTRVRGMLAELFGNLYLGGTGADETGTIGIKLNALTELSGQVYGVVQRILVSENSGALFINELKSLEKLAVDTVNAAQGTLAVVPFSTFAREMRTIAPDMVTKIASDLLAGSNLSGVVLAAFNASNEKFDKLTSQVTDFKEQQRGLSAIEQQKWAERSVAERMRTYDFDNSVYAANSVNVVITPDAALDEFRTAFEHNAELMLQAAEVQRAAALLGLSLDYSTTTTAGISADAAARSLTVKNELAVLSEANKFIKNAAEFQALYSSLTTTTREGLEASLDSVTTYVYKLTEEALKTGDVRTARAALNALSTQINKKNLKSLDNLFVGTQQFKFNIAGLPDEVGDKVFAALDELVDTAGKTINNSVPKLLSTYNDITSRIYRGIEAATKRAIADGTDVGVAVKNVVDKLNTEFGILINTTGKLETAFGMADEISAVWAEFRKSFDLHELEKLTSDPFRYLNLEEAVGKMYSDLERLSGRSIKELLLDVNTQLANNNVMFTADVDLNDLVNKIGLRNAYNKLFENASQHSFGKYGSMQIPYVGDAGDFDVSEFINEVAKDAEEAADTVIRIIPNIGEHLSENVDEIAEGLKALPLGDAMDDAIDDVLDDALNEVLDNIVVDPGLLNRALGGISKTIKNIRVYLKDQITKLFTAASGVDLKAGLQNIFSKLTDNIAVAAASAKYYSTEAWKTLSSINVGEILFGSDSIKPDVIFANADDFLSQYSKEFQQHLSDVISKEDLNGLIGVYTNKFGQAPSSSNIWRMIAAGNEYSMTGAAGNVYEAVNANGLTGKAWYDTIVDDITKEALLNKATPEQATALAQFYDSFTSSLDADDLDAFFRAEGIGDEGLKNTEKAIRDAAKEAFGDEFSSYDDLIKAINNPEYIKGNFLDKLKVTAARTLQNKFIGTMLTPNEIGLSGLDLVFAFRRGIDAMDAGVDEYNTLVDKMAALSKYNINPLDSKGNINDTGNLVNIGDALTVGLQSVAVEGILTNIITGAAVGSSGGPVGTIVGLVAAIAADIGMVLSGAYNIANVASEEIKEMLNNTSWAADQVKAQGGTDKEAKEAQLNIARDLYTNYYNNMSSIWSMYDKASIRSIDKYGSDNFTGEKNKSSYRFAVEEILGRPDIYGLQKSKTETGWLNYGEGDTGWVARELDAAKMEQQLYTLYTTGGMDKILNKKGKYTDLEEDWLYRLDYLGEYQIAQLNDYYRNYVNAIQYINEHTKEEIVTLLQGYNLPANTIQDMVEGIVAIYRAGVEQMNQLIDIKGQFINLGSISAVGLDELATGTGSVMRAMEGDLTGIDQKYLDMLADATGVYVSAMSDTMYTLAYDIEAVRDKMTGFTVTFPDTVTVGADTISVKDIASNTKSVEILQGMGIHINNDGTITVSTEAVNANESGHDRRMAVSYNDISAYELSALSNAGIDLSNSRNDKTRISLNEAAMQNSIKGMTYNLTGVDLQAVSEATVTALKAKGILLSQNQETGATYATITDTGFITGANDIAALISSLDPDTVARMSENLKGALRGIDAINAFGNKHGESRMGSAAGIEIDTGLLGSEYSAALEQAFSEAGVKLQRTVDAAGNEHVYAAINNVGEQWHKAITQWRSSDITPELEKFLQSLGVEVVKYGDYTMVSTEDVIKNLSKSSSSGLRNILFDNAELWEQFPEETKNAFIAVGLATEDGFIKLDTEAIDGWYRYEVDGQTHMAKAFEAMEKGIVDHFIKMQGTTVVSWSALTEEQRLALEKLGITTEQQYNTNSDELLQLITGSNAVVKDNVVQGWNTLSAEQKALLAQIGIENEEQYAAHFQELYTIGNTNFGILNEDTILGWDELSGTTKAKLSEMGITTEAQYNKYLSDMDVATGQGLATVDATTAQSLLKIGVTTSSGWGDIKQVTDTTLSETEKLALGYMKFEDLPETVRNALSMEAGVGKDLHDSWWAINADADTQLDIFSNTVDGMAADLNRVKDLAAQLKQALADPGLQAETLMANLAAGSATALEAAKSGSDKWAKMGGTSHGNAPGGWGGAWENWNNNIQITSSKVGISEVHTDSAGNPMVYYIYNLNINGSPGQIIKNADGVWHKYYGTQEYNENHLPGFKLGGMVTGDGLFRAGEFGLNEAIVPLEQPQAMRKIGNALAAALPTWELVAPLQQAIGMRDGGVASFDSFRSVQKEQSVEDIVTRIMDVQAHKAPTGDSRSAEDLRPLYVGTLIADKAGLRELDRQMKRVVRQDGGM